MPHASLSDAGIARIASGVLDRTLPKPEWTHPAHFAATLWLLRHYPGFDGRRDMPAIIRGYNAATDTPNTDSSGYHETITFASLAAAQAALRSAPAAPLPIILDGLLAGPCGRSDWLMAHWTRALLFTPAARHHWVEPDRAPLPFGGETG